MRRGLSAYRTPVVRVPPAAVLGPGASIVLLIKRRALMQGDFGGVAIDITN